VIVDYKIRDRDRKMIFIRRVRLSQTGHSRLPRPTENPIDSFSIDTQLAGDLADVAVVPLERFANATNFQGVLFFGKSQG
jgi:hypothetical protein